MHLPNLHQLTSVLRGDQTCLRHFLDACKVKLSEKIILIFVLLEPITLKRRLRSPYLELRNRQKGRERRSVSMEKNVEMLMVADKTMYEFYMGGLEEYLLTIANMVCFYCF